MLTDRNELLRLGDVRCLECAATFGGCALPGMCCYVWWMCVAWNVLLRLVDARCLECAAADRCPERDATFGCC